MKPVFFIDYDNTIFSHQTWSIPESSLEALIRLHEDGYKIALASGRAFRSDSLPEEFHGASHRTVSSVPTAPSLR